MDRFILAGLEVRGLKPSPQADRRTLLRRASFVLTGLPPTLEEVAAFESDRSPRRSAGWWTGCWRRRGMGNGGRGHWLDIARYADTKGYVFEEERRYAVCVHLPGLRDSGVQRRHAVRPVPGGADRGATRWFPAEDKSALAAMGFLTLGRRFLNNPHDIIDDRIDVLTRGTMGLTVACARCHDHKYDPVPIGGLLLAVRGVCVVAGAGGEAVAGDDSRIRCGMRRSRRN
jgi:hypothetical protein